MGISHELMEHWMQFAEDAEDKEDAGNFEEEGRPLHVRYRLSSQGVRNATSQARSQRKGNVPDAGAMKW